jgi:UDP:flavonoid glycosyltransferase YjiC (YdhE family)
MNAAWLPPINAARSAVGLPPLDDVAREGFYSPLLNLVAVSPRVFPQPRAWPSQHRLSGYWLLDAAPRWEPPDEVRAFVEREPKPVAIGFGSMASSDADALRATVLEAVSRAGVRAVIEPGLARLGGEGNPDVLVADDVPHGWLLPRVAALVHHGGAGTTGAALHAGVPMVVVPHLYDQHFWARRAKELGVAPKPLPAKEINAGLLASAIRRAVGDERMRAKARSLAAALQHEDGPGVAVRLVEECAGAATAASRA